MKSMIIEKLSNRVNMVKCSKIGYSQWSCHNRSLIIKRYYGLCTSKEPICQKWRSDPGPRGRGFPYFPIFYVMPSKLPVNISSMATSAISKKPLTGQWEINSTQSTVSQFPSRQLQLQGERKSKSS